MKMRKNIDTQYELGGAFQMFRKSAQILVGALTLGATAVVAAPDYYADVITVQVIQHKSEVVLGGTVVPAKQVTIAAQMPGKVEYIAGTEGDRFAKNSELVALDDDELLAQRRAAIAQMGNADAALRNAGVQFNRELESPSSRNTISGMGVPGMFDQMFTRNFSDMMGYQSPGTERRADLYARSTGVDQARSSFLQAQSRVEEIDAKLKDVIGYAPFDGVIVKKLVEIGDIVQPGQPLIEFADTESLQIRVDVPARIMPGITDGQAMRARLDVGDTPILVKVAQIFPMADPRRHTVTIKLDIDANAPAAPGMYAEVMVPNLNSPTETIPVIPESAIVQRGSLPAVFVVQPDGSTQLRVVRTGTRIDENNISVISGLSGGERILDKPRPGMTSQPR